MVNIVLLSSLLIAVISFVITKLLKFDTVETTIYSIVVGICALPIMGIFYHMLNESVEHTVGFVIFVAIPYLLTVFYIKPNRNRIFKSTILSTFVAIILGSFFGNLIGSLVEEPTSFSELFAESEEIPSSSNDTNDNECDSYTYKYKEETPEKDAYTSSTKVISKWDITIKIGYEFSHVYMTITDENGTYYASGFNGREKLRKSGSRFYVIGSGTGDYYEISGDRLIIGDNEGDMSDTYSGRRVY